MDLGDGQEDRIQAFPSQAVDEVLTNALVHRDWSVDRSINVAMIGRLPTMSATSWGRR
ncbi:hypothetical protein KRX51_00495 [Corynebacterium sp. TAE3-ERU12]|uniref:hypothetical protein n=1 Tax=Corynebacterium sp. TAE3-ERU12 TaxID=2849491 RepID=UPI001C4667C2|nr:hypothetical protein [Corynebacterium sp. TAE3-ERU12]MBV7294403.1 hypothetical protein [Corynebacterium sp. TAE3-ERU12]